MRARRTTLFAVVLAALAWMVAPPASATSTPDITGISPRVAPEYGGPAVRIHGQHLSNVVNVRFGPYYGTLARVLSDSDVLVYPPKVPRPLTTHVAVYLGNGQRTSWSDPQALFTFAPPPMIHDVTPNVGPETGGALITVHGSNFLGVQRVRVGGFLATGVRVLSPTTLTFVSPPGYPGVVEVHIEGAYGVSPQVSHFRLLPRPLVTSVAPQSGPTSGGDTVALTGFSFTPPVHVSVDGIPARLIGASDAGHVSFVMPPHAAGTVHVRVTAAGGYSAPSTLDQYTFTVANPDVWSFGADPDVSRGLMEDVSCPTETFCAAVDAHDIYTQSNGVWSTPTTVAGPLATVSCASATFCLAGGRAGALRYDGFSWTALAASPALKEVRCPDANTCFAVSDPSGQIYRWDAALGWSQQQGPTYVHRISCATTTSCLAITPSSVAVYDGTDWTTTAASPNIDLADVSCASPTLCAVVDGSGAAMTWDGVRWGPRTVLFDQRASRVACAQNYCVAADADGDIAELRTGQWTRRPSPLIQHQAVPRPDSPGIRGAACADASSCVLVDAAGHAIALEGTTWSAAQPVFDDFRAPSTLSCPTTTWCAAADNDGNVVTGGPQNWSASLRAVDLTGATVDLTCTSPSFCVLVSSQRAPVVWNGGSWTATAGPAALAVSCVSTTRCVTPNAVFDGTTWSRLAAPRLSAIKVSCVGATSCVAVGEPGQATSLSGSGWGPLVNITWNGGLAADVSCVSPGTCIASTSSGSAIAMRNGVWQTAVPVEPYASETQASPVSCTTGSWCARADSAGIEVFDGAHWSAPQPGHISDLSCPAPDRCVALTFSGATVTSAPR